MKFIASNLTSNDQFGCVGYDEKVRTIANLKYVTSAVKQDTLRAIDCMEPKTLTALGEGLESGVNMMRECVISDSKDIIRALTDR